MGVAECANSARHSACVEAGDQLVAWCQRVGLIEYEDLPWARNVLFALVGDEGAPYKAPSGEMPVSFDDDCPMAPDALNVLVRLLKERRERLGEGEAADGDEGLRAQIMAAIMPRPSDVIHRFWMLMCDDPRMATDFLYRLSGSSDYVKHAAIARNEQWETPTEWGNLLITVNLSKPEKDPRAIAHAASVQGESYPRCALCWENEGYAGRNALSQQGNHAARQNLRIVPLQLGEERWGLQYSPYAYYREHCIVLSSEHRPMHVDRGNIERLCDFVDMFPHYFVGSNADLPLVGGSILSHDHFQGGRFEFPLDRAPLVAALRDSRWPDVKIGVVKWPTTVLRFIGADRAQVLDAVCALMDVWRDYDDAQVGILSHDADGTRHNTVTPIVRKLDGCYRVDVALRCNVTSSEHPWGVFHPHEELHHIKRENIGLIEVMGLAILPPRLKRELSAIAHIVVDEWDGVSYDALEHALSSNSDCAAHATWTTDLMRSHPEVNAENVQIILRAGVGKVFERVLEDTGVFKWDNEGRDALGRFCAHAGLSLS